MHQLQMGVRYLDFSVRVNKNYTWKLRVYSNGYDIGVSFLEALQVCQAFLVKFPNEVIFVAVEEVRVFYCPPTAILLAFYCLNTPLQIYIDAWWRCGYWILCGE